MYKPAWLPHTSVCEHFFCQLHGDVGGKKPTCWNQGAESKEHILFEFTFLLQEGGPLPGPESGLLSNTWKWIVWEDTHVDKARDFIVKEHLGESGRVSERRSTALPRATSLGFCGDGVSFRVVSGQMFWLGVLPGGTCDQNQNSPYHETEWPSQVIAQNTKYKTNRQSCPNQTLP